RVARVERTGGDPGVVGPVPEGMVHRRVDNRAPAVRVSYGHVSESDVTVDVDRRDGTARRSVRRRVGRRYLVAGLDLGDRFARPVGQQDPRTGIEAAEGPGPAETASTSCRVVTEQCFEVAAAVGNGDAFPTSSGCGFACAHEAYVRSGEGG